MTTQKLKSLGAIKTELQKFAQDIENPIEAAAPPQGSPEEVMELIDDAIQVLEVAEESIPAETPEEGQPAVGPSPPAFAKRRGAQTDLNPQDDDPDKKEKAKEARIRKAQDEEKKDDDETEKEKNARVRKAIEHDARRRGARDEDEDKEKKELEARIASLEGELTSRQKEAIAQEFVELYPESVRQSKFDEIVNGKDSVKLLEAKIKLARDVIEANQKNSYVPAKNQSGYLPTKTAKLQTTLQPWRI